MWLEHLHSKEALDRIFKDEIFGETIELRRMSFEDLDTKIKFDLREWPKNAPRKWTEQNFNTVQIVLVLGRCSEIHLKDWAIDNVGEFRVKKIEGTELYSFKFVSASGAYFSCMCDVLLFSKVSAYQNA